MKFYDSISQTMAKQGINTMTGTMYDFIADWHEWYRGNVNNFHTYTEKLVNGKSVKRERLTLNMAKKVCEDMTKLIWTEKTQITLGTPGKTAQLWGVLDSKQNNLSVNLPGFIERAMALGTGMLVEYMVGENVLIDFVDADLIVPFEWNNSYVSGVLTVGRSTEEIDSKKQWYSLLTLHAFRGGIYRREHQLYRSKSPESLGDKVNLATKYADLPETQEWKTSTPHFQIYRPNIVNNLDKNSPMGISIFANRIDNLREIDTVFDSLSQEFTLGKKRILVDRTAVKGSIDPETGESVQYLDTSDSVYVAINGMEHQPIKDVDFKLRVEEHTKALNAALNYLSAGVGLGQDFYNFDGSNAAKTATEVISEQSDTFRSKVSHEIILRDVLFDLVKSICHLSKIEVSDDEISIIFDDSVIEDKEAAARQALIEFNAGLIDKVEYFVRARGMDREKAIAYVGEIEARNSSITEEEPDEE